MSGKKTTEFDEEERQVLRLDHGFFGLGDYVALDDDQQEDLLCVADIVRSYIKRSRGNTPFERPLNVYLEASPGSGKSFLVKRLCGAVSSDSFDGVVEYIYYNLSTMESKDELFGIFNRVQSINLNKKVPLVFFDEIDTEIEPNKYVYKHFLTPMFDGVFYENAVSLKLGPAVFFFAGSKRLRKFFVDKEGVIPKKYKKDERELGYREWQKNEKDIFDFVIKEWREKSSGAPDKILDFIDRIDELVYIPSLRILPNNDPDQGSQQASIIIASMIKARYPETIYIERTALDLLVETLIDTDNKRIIDSIIIMSTPPIEDRFYKECLPKKLLVDEERALEKAERDQVGQFRWYMIGVGNEELLIDEYP